MGSEYTKAYKKISRELTEAGVTTKAVASEDGSNLTMRSAEEIDKILSIARKADAEASGAGRIRLLRTRTPGAY